MRIKIKTDPISGMLVWYLKNGFIAAEMYRDELKQRYVLNCFGERRELADADMLDAQAWMTGTIFEILKKLEML